MSSQQLNFSDIQTALVVGTDICAGRHRNSPESNDAHERILNQKAEAYQKIMFLFQNRGERGATSHEVSAATGMPLQTVSARLSELRHKLGKLKKKESGETRRNGAAVLVEA